jgi:hypothetical protein
MEIGQKVKANTRGVYFRGSEYDLVHGRKGKVVRHCCDVFSDYMTVLFDPIGRRKEKELMMRIACLEPIETDGKEG